jgi:hypothetical protein
MPDEPPPLPVLTDERPPARIRYSREGFWYGVKWIAVCFVGAALLLGLLSLVLDLLPHTHHARL